MLLALCSKGCSVGTSWTTAAGGLYLTPGGEKRFGTGGAVGVWTEGMDVADCI